jgi:hypothetical protein
MTLLFAALMELRGKLYYGKWEKSIVYMSVHLYNKKYLKKKCKGYSLTKLTASGKLREDIYAI